MKGFTMAEVRRNLSDLVGRVAYGGERIVIQRRDKPLVALVPIEDAEFLERLEDEIDLREAEKAMKEKGPNLKWDKVKKELGLK